MLGEEVIQLHVATPIYTTRRVFFPCRCFTDFLLKKFAMETKQKWSLVIKHINWVDNHQLDITAKYGSYHFTSYGENAI